MLYASVSYYYYCLLLLSQLLEKQLGNLADKKTEL